MVNAQGNVLVYERTAEAERILVCLNFGDTEQRISSRELERSIVLACTHGDRARLDSNLVLRPNEGLMILMTEAV